jgi:hypothetical protein
MKTEMPLEVIRTGFIDHDKPLKLEITEMIGGMLGFGKKPVDVKVFLERDEYRVGETIEVKFLGDFSHLKHEKGTFGIILMREMIGTDADRQYKSSADVLEVAATHFIPQDKASQETTLAIKLKPSMLPTLNTELLQIKYTITVSIKYGSSELK